jgi:hypothetical protein
MSYSSHVPVRIGALDEPAAHEKGAGVATLALSV